MPALKKLTDHFYEHELACPTGECRMDPHFMIQLEALRVIMNVEFLITSGYRSAAYNSILKGAADQSLHPKGKAVDVDHQKWDGATKHRFIREASARGFSIGVYAKHFHIDLREGPQVLWIKAASAEPKP